uniref:Guanylate cyclase n=1 Tax=Sparus aurata TaxID=8175 RepID=A0A671UMT6_SPAAU
SITTHCQLPTWLLGTCLWLLCITGVWTATFKLAVIGPWSCDPMFSRAMPTAAANLALSRLRRDSSLSRGYRYDVKLLEEDCSASKALTELGDMEGYGHAYIGPFNPALCHAASLLAQHWEVGLASPGCLDADWLNLPPITPPSRVLFTVLRFFRWAHVAIVSAPTDLWEGTGEELASALRAQGLPIGPVVTMETRNKGGPREALKVIREADKVKVVIMCMSSVLIGGEDQRDLLLAALDMGMVSDGYVFIPYDALLYAMPYQLIINKTVDFSPEFCMQVSPIFGTIFNMVYYVAKAVEERRQAGSGRWVTGDQLIQSDGGFDFQGFNQVRIILTSNKSEPATDNITFIYFLLESREIKTSDSPESVTCSPDRFIMSTSSTPEWLIHVDILLFICPLQLREMRHENLNLYVGLFLDSGIFALVVEHCPRGSLADLLADSNMRLDWMFKSSLLMDLIKGMKYLHLRGLSHGRLKSTNCLVDGRFVLKITDYGLPMILHSQNFHLPEDPQELLWTAPELLRKPVRGGSFAGDVFSFSIIIQEVISRTLPYAMMDMPAHEILERLKEPPPLCRPLVSVDEAPAECLSLMNECWNEDPSKRPSFDDIFKQFRGINRGKRANIIDSMLRMLEQYSSNLEDLIRERTDELEVERNKTEKLVGQLLPKSVAQALKKGKPVRPEHYSDCTLYFSDIVGFTTISALSEPIEVVDLLNDLYTMFDAIIATHDVYKVETIGDAYMVASGVPNRNGTRHAAEVANMSLDILHSIAAFKIKHMPEIKVKIRIGLHSGAVVAGVVGLTMPRYCLFGDTVTTASHMEASGLPYRIHISLCTVKVLTSLKLGYRMDTRKVKGAVDTYWLTGRDGFDKPLPVPPDLTGGASNHGISLDEIPIERRQKFLDRQKIKK